MYNLLVILHHCGMKEFEDFTTLDTVDSTMWCCAKPEMRKRPFLVDTRIGWLKGQSGRGTSGCGSAGSDLAPTEAGFTIGLGAACDGGA